MTEKLIVISHNSAEVMAALMKVRARYGTMAPALKGMGHYLELATRMRFDTETDPDGKKWRALKAATVARKKAKGKPTAILREEDNLRDHINSRVEGETLLVGSPEPYAAIQFLGGNIPEHTVVPKKARALNIPGIGFRRRARIPEISIPARQALGVSREDEAELLLIAGDYLLR